MIHKIINYFKLFYCKDIKRLIEENELLKEELKFEKRKNKCY